MIVAETIAVAFAMFSAIPVPQPVWNEKKHAACDVCVSVGRSGLRSGVCLLDSFMRRLAGPGAGCRRADIA